MDNIEDWAGFDMAAVIALVNGKFDDRLAQIAAERQKLDEKYGTVQTLEEAQKLKDDAEKSAADLIASANARLQDAAAKEKDLADRENQVAAGKKAIAEDQSEIDSQRAMLLALKTQVDMQKQNNGVAEQSLIEREARLATDRASLEAEKQMFNQKLMALKA